MLFELLRAASGVDAIRHFYPRGVYRHMSREDLHLMVDALHGYDRAAIEIRDEFTDALAQ